MTDKIDLKVRSVDDEAVFCLRAIALMSGQSQGEILTRMILKFASNLDRGMTSNSMVRLADAWERVSHCDRISDEDIVDALVPYGEEDSRRVPTSETIVDDYKAAAEAVRKQRNDDAARKREARSAGKVKQRR